MRPLPVSRFRQQSSSPLEGEVGPALGTGRGALRAAARRDAFGERRRTPHPSTLRVADLPLKGGGGFSFGRLYVVALAALLACGAQAQPAPQPADWPCQQRLVPTLTAGTYWSGPPLPADWQGDPRVAGLVADLAPREMQADEGTAKIKAFAKGLKPAEKPVLLAKVFVGLVAETNRERSQVIDRLEELARRQRGIADQVAKVTTELEAVPADAAGDEATRRAEIVDRRAFLTRTFDDTQRTMRYACDVPTQLEARLGAYARTLQAQL